MTQDIKQRANWIEADPRVRTRWLVGVATLCMIIVVILAVRLVGDPDVGGTAAIAAAGCARQACLQCEPPANCGTTGQARAPGDWTTGMPLP
jgi:hypothetical protein